MTGKTIDVLYFAQVAELVGTRQETWEHPQPMPVSDWMQQLQLRHPALAPTGRLQLAINQYHAGPDDTIAPGDEVAVFEPVTGG